MGVSGSLLVVFLHPSILSLILKDSEINNSTRIP